MAQSLAQAQEALGYGCISSYAPPLAALAPCNSNTVQASTTANMSLDAGLAAAAATGTPGPHAMPGTPLSAATPLVNSSIFGQNAPATPWSAVGGAGAYNMLQACCLYEALGYYEALSSMRP